MPRYAVIDIGTNSVKMTVADVEFGSVSPVPERSQITRLGRGVDQTKRLADDSMAATLEAMNSFCGEARGLGATQIKSGGTSALRDAENGAEFITRAKEITEGDVELIGGDREAQLSFAAAVSDPAITAGVADAPLLVFDAGGGSTELIVGRPGHIDLFQSIDLGAVRLTERVLKSDPPSHDEIAHVRTLVGEALQTFPKQRISRIVGTGGTAVTVAKMLDPGADDVQAIRIPRSGLQGVIDELRDLSNEEKRKIPGLEPARADVILGGLLIIDGILTQFGHDEFVVSTRGVRYGLLLEMAEEKL